MRERFELALDAKQICAVLIGSLVILGGTFVLGMSVGRMATGAPPQAIAAPRDALARLDEPLPVHEESAPDLKAHQALTDVRPIEKLLPVPAVKPTALPVAGSVPIAPAPPVAGSDPNTQAAPVDPVLQKPAPPAMQARSDGTDSHAAGTAAKPAIAAKAPLAKAGPVGSRPATRIAHAAAHDAQKRAGAKRRGYAIQVGSSPRRADAERLAKKLSGRNPRIVGADVPGKGHVYRVLIGAYDSPDAANRQLATLSRGGVHGIVTAVR